MNNKVAFITNISFPKTLEELLFFMEDSYHFNVEDVLIEDDLEWTAPKWCKEGNIVFFMHSKTSISTITALRTEYRYKKDNYKKDEQNLLEFGIKHGLELYDRYGGKIFAIGIVWGKSFIEPNMYDVELHWKSKVYAPIKKIYVLDNPVDISSFSEFIKVSRTGAITDLNDEQYIKLMKIVSEKNRI